MEKFSNISEEQAKIINGGTITAGIEFAGICIALFLAGWEVGRGIAREVKSW